jgi:starvation-inducible DNA-binding protein
MPKTATTPLANERLNVGLEEDKRGAIVETLNALLADEHVLYIKTRNYHWNVRGPRFNDLHKFFEAQYTEVADIIDEVAENARQFGGFAVATMSDFLQGSRLKEQPGEFPDDDTMIRNLLADHEAIIRQLRKDIDRATDQLGAPDAADFLTGVLEDHDKMAWMLRSYLADKR